MSGETHGLVAIPSLSTRLVTDRLVLRPARSSDVGRIRQALRENATHLRPWRAAPAPGEDPAALASVSRTILGDRTEWKAGQTFALLVLPREDESVVVGRVALSGVHRGAFQNAYLGYWIDSGLQGRGLMTEAVVAVTAFAFGSANLHRIQAAVTPRNLASQRVLTKAGYRQEGLAQRYLCVAGSWEDHFLYAITAEDWSSRGT
jgi:ribosomal-protein-alanine N-acetyltransferase